MHASRAFPDDCIECNIVSRMSSTKKSGFRHWLERREAWFSWSHRRSTKDKEPEPADTTGGSSEQSHLLLPEAVKQDSNGHMRPTEFRYRRASPESCIGTQALKRDTVSSATGRGTYPSFFGTEYSRLLPTGPSGILSDDEPLEYCTKEETASLSRSHNNQDPTCHPVSNQFLSFSAAGASLGSSRLGPSLISQA